MFLFGKLFERGKRLIPQLRKMVAQHRQALGIQFVNPARAFAPITHQPRILQYPKVLRNGRPRYRQARGQLAHSLRMVTQHLENRQARRVAQSRQSALQVSIHLP